MTSATPPISAIFPTDRLVEDHVTGRLDSALSTVTGALSSAKSYGGRLVSSIPSPTISGGISLIKSFVETVGTMPGIGSGVATVLSGTALAIWQTNKAIKELRRREVADPGFSWMDVSKHVLGAGAGVGIAVLGGVTIYYVAQGSQSAAIPNVKGPLATNVAAALKDTVTSNAALATNASFSPSDVTFKLPFEEVILPFKAPLESATLAVNGTVVANATLALKEPLAANASVVANATQAVNQTLLNPSTQVPFKLLQKQSDPLFKGIEEKLMSEAMQYPVPKEIAGHIAPPPPVPTQIVDHGIRARPLGEDPKFVEEVAQSDLASTVYDWTVGWFTKKKN